MTTLYIGQKVCPILSETVDEQVQEQSRHNRPTIIAVAQEVLSQTTTYFQALSLNNYFISKNSFESPISRQQYEKVIYLWNVSLENSALDATFHKIATVNQQDFSQSQVIYYSYAYTAESSDTRIEFLIKLIQHTSQSQKTDELKFHCKALYNEFLNYCSSTSQSLLHTIEKELSSLTSQTDCLQTQTLIQLVRYLAKLPYERKNLSEECNPLATFFRGLKLENSYLRTLTDRKEALSIFEKILETHPNNEVAKYHILKITAETNPKDIRLQELNTQCDLKTYQYALTRNIKDNFALTNMGLIYYKNGSLLAAKKCFKNSLTLNPNHEITALHWGIMLFKGQAVPINYQRAKTQFLKVLKLNPQNAQANYFLGMIYREGNQKIPTDESKAFAYFKECLNNEPEHQNACFEFSQLILNRERFQTKDAVTNAIELTKKQLEIDPNNHTIQKQLGNLLLLPIEGISDPKKGIQLLETVFENNPKNSDLGIFLSRVYVDGTHTIEKDVSKAHELIQKVRSHGPETPAIIYTLGKIIPHLPNISYSDLTVTIHKVETLAKNTSNTRDTTLILINLLLTALQPKFLPTKTRISGGIITSLTTTTELSLSHHIKELCQKLLEENPQDTEVIQYLSKVKRPHHPSNLNK